MNQMESFWLPGDYSNGALVYVLQGKVQLRTTTKEPFGSAVHEAASGNNNGGMSAGSSDSSSAADADRCDSEAAANAADDSELKALFDSIDKDGSGAIDVQELQYALSVMGIDKSPEEVQELMDSVDKDGSGELEFEKFVVILRTNLGLGGKQQSSWRQQLDESWVKEFGQRDSFGEAGLSTGEAQSGLVVALEDCSLLVLDAASYRAMLTHGFDKQVNANLAALRSCAAFSNCLTNKSDWRGLAYTAVSENYSWGGQLYAAGQAATTMYILQEGACKVIVKRQVSSQLASTATAASGITESSTTAEFAVGSATDGLSLPDAWQAPSSAARAASALLASPRQGLHSPRSRLTERRLEVAVLGPGDLAGEASFLNLPVHSSSAVVNSAHVFVLRLEVQHAKQYIHTADAQRLCEFLQLREDDRQQRIQAAAHISCAVAWKQQDTRPTGADRSMPQPTEPPQPEARALAALPQGSGLTDGPTTTQLSRAAGMLVHSAAMPSRATQLRQLVHIVPRLSNVSESSSVTEPSSPRSPSSPERKTMMSSLSGLRQYQGVGAPLLPSSSGSAAAAIADAGGSPRRQLPSKLRREPAADAALHLQSLVAAQVSLDAAQSSITSAEVQELAIARSTTGATLASTAAAAKSHSANAGVSPDSFFLSSRPTSAAGRATTRAATVVNGGLNGRCGIFAIDSKPGISSSSGPASSVAPSTGMAAAQAPAASGSIQLRRSPVGAPHTARFLQLSTPAPAIVPVEHAPATKAPASHWEPGAVCSRARNNSIAGTSRGDSSWGSSCTGFVESTASLSVADGSYAGSNCFSRSGGSSTGSNSMSWAGTLSSNSPGVHTSSSGVHSSHSAAVPGAVGNSASLLPQGGMHLSKARPVAGFLFAELDTGLWEAAESAADSTSWSLGTRLMQPQQASTSRDEGNKLASSSNQSASLGGAALTGAVIGKAKQHEQLLLPLSAPAGNVTCGSSLSGAPNMQQQQQQTASPHVAAVPRLQLDKVQQTGTASCVSMQNGVIGAFRESPRLHNISTACQHHDGSRCKLSIPMSARDGQQLQALLGGPFGPQSDGDYATQQLTAPLPGWCSALTTRWAAGGRFLKSGSSTCRM